MESPKLPKLEVGQKCKYTYSGRLRDKELSHSGQVVEIINFVGWDPFYHRSYNIRTTDGLEFTAWDDELKPIQGDHHA